MKVSEILSESKRSKNAEALCAEKWKDSKYWKGDVMKTFKEVVTAAVTETFPSEFNAEALSIIRTEGMWGHDGIYAFEDALDDWITDYDTPEEIYAEVKKNGETFKLIEEAIDSTQKTLTKGVQMDGWNIITTMAKVKVPVIQVGGATYTVKFDEKYKNDLHFSYTHRGDGDVKVGEQFMKTDRFKSLFTYEIMNKLGEWHDGVPGVFLTEPLSKPKIKFVPLFTREELVEWLLEGLQNENLRQEEIGEALVALKKQGIKLDISPEKIVAWFDARKDKTIKRLLLDVKNEQHGNVERRIKLMKKLGVDWPELDSIDKSVKAFGRKK